MIDPKKTIVCDVDHTILFTTNRDYANSVPNLPVISKLKEARESGWRVVLYTARGMGRSGGNIELVKEEVVEEISSFCLKFSVPYDELVVGKPWGRLYVDDKAIRPDEFANLDLDSLKEVGM